MAQPQTLTIEITAGHCLGGQGNDVYPGQRLTAPKDLTILEALKKVRMGYARIVTPDEKAHPVSTEASGGAAIQTHDATPQDRDPEIDPPSRPRGRPPKQRSSS
jgi:hypothetical protein